MSIMSSGSSRKLRGSVHVALQLRTNRLRGFNPLTLLALRVEILRNFGPRMRNVSQTSRRKARGQEIRQAFERRGRNSQEGSRAHIGGGELRLFMCT